jgi:hypothetical protein
MSGVYTEDDEGDYQVVITWRHGDKTGTYETTAHLTFVDGKMSCFMWEEGNYACDCNRGPMFGLGDEWTCGETIEVLSIDIAPSPYAPPPPAADE